MSLFSILSIAQNNLTQFQEANNLYQSKKYNQSIEVYEEILNSGERSAELYFNLGNAYFRNNNLGQAVLNFERALIEDPSFEDAQYNLEIANEKQVDELDNLPAFFLKSWWNSLRQFTSEAVWSFIALLLLWSGIGGIVIWLLSMERTHKKKGFFLGIILIILSILPFSLASSRAKFEQNSQKAILLENKITLKNGPDKASTDLIQIHEGLKLDLLDKIGNWYKVRLSNGEEGWLPEGSFEEI